MVELITGNKGKGKTKVLLERVNAEVKTESGNIVYIDKDNKHMFELNNKIRLICASDYPLRNSDEFVGFVLGLVSQDHDLSIVYLDNFLKIAKLDSDSLTGIISELDKISETFKINFVLSVSLDKTEIPESLQDKISVAL